MGYTAGKRTSLPPEKSSKLNHMSILNNSFIARTGRALTPQTPTQAELRTHGDWLQIPRDGVPLDHVVAVDGSYAEVEVHGNARVAFITTAAVEIPFVSTLHRENLTHPMEMRDFLEDVTTRHSTVLPLEQLSFNEEDVYRTTLAIILETLLNAPDLLETLNWLASQAWVDDLLVDYERIEFACPYCGEEVAMIPNHVTHHCESCHEEVSLVDWLGLHRLVGNQLARQNVASSFMLVLETLQLFTHIRELWQYDRDRLRTTLFLKDGPLALYGGASVLVTPIRRFLQHAAESGYPIALLGQEKTGLAVAYLDRLRRRRRLDDQCVFVPEAKFMAEQVYGRRFTTKTRAGAGEVYGAHVFTNHSPHRAMVLSIPTGSYTPVPEATDLHRFHDVMATMESLFSHSHENALWPLELAHRFCSIGVYPSHTVLQRFMEDFRSNDDQPDMPR